VSGSGIRNQDCKAWHLRHAVHTKAITTTSTRGLVAGVEGDKVRLSATGAVAVTMEEEKN
jgi:hypothetical protein